MKSDMTLSKRNKAKSYVAIFTKCLSTYTYQYLYQMPFNLYVSIFIPNAFQIIRINIYTKCLSTYTYQYLYQMPFKLYVSIFIPNAFQLIRINIYTKCLSTYTYQYLYQMPFNLYVSIFIPNAFQIIRINISFSRSLPNFITPSTPSPYKYIYILSFKNT